MQEQTILRQDYFCPLAQKSHADCAHVTWLKAFKTQTVGTAKMLKAHLALQCQSQALKSDLFLNRHSRFLIVQIPDTCSQGRTDLQSLVKCLDHTIILSDTVCSHARLYQAAQCNDMP